MRGLRTRESALLVLNRYGFIVASVMQIIGCKLVPHGLGCLSARPFVCGPDCELKRGASDMRGNRRYVHLAIMIALSFISMYVLIYPMGKKFANSLHNSK